jgi:hypothetical protein
MLLQIVRIPTAPRPAVALRAAALLFSFPLMLSQWGDGSAQQRLYGQQYPSTWNGQAPAAQGVQAPQGQSGSSTGNAATPPGASTPSWIVYDRFSGRWYQQHTVAVSVPAVRWEYQPMQQTVYEVQPRVKQQTSQQTVMVPQTQTVMVPRVTGALNPFRRPAQSYQFEPVTTWVPRTVQVETAVVVPEVVARQQTVNVPQPVQTTQMQHQIVQREIAPPTGGMPLGAVAVNPRPVFPLNPRGGRLNDTTPPRMIGSSLLAANSIPPMPASGAGVPPGIIPVPSQTLPGQVAQAQSPVLSPNQAQQLADAPPFGRSAVPTTMPNRVAGSPGLRPITAPAYPFNLGLQPPYAAPLSAASATNIAVRDETQTGMAATVLR